MSFFDKKEEVMHIELTPYGRYMLSIGKLAPDNYCFFDDDIVYDSTAIGMSETQNQTHNRIVNDTPKLKTNANVIGVDTHINEFAEESVLIDDVRYESKFGNINAKQQIIGTNSRSSEDAPSWDLKVYDNEINRIRKFLSGSSKPADNYSNTPFMNIPQIDLEIVYDWEIITPDTEPSNASGVTSIENVISSMVFDDGSYFRIDAKTPIVKLIEENSFDTIDNFDIKVYKIEEQSANGRIKEFFRPLKFPAESPLVQNDILLDTDDVIYDTSFDSNPDEVQYFFDLVVDRDISDADLCRTIGALEVENIFLDEGLKCPEISDVVPNIYETSVLPSDLEDCD
jgi:hypothetical protein